MSGCGCDGGCSRRREEMTMNPAVLQSALKNLFTVAVTGIKSFPWPNDEIAELADLIARLLAENERLKKLLRLNNPEDPQVIVDKDRLRLRLGPDNAYTLDIPVGTPAQRQALARNLAAAAAELQRAAFSAPSLPGQLPLPFDA